MKSYAILVLGMILGAIAAAVVINPQETGTKVHQGVDAVQTKVHQMKHEQCVRDFLAESQCFQKRPARECDAVIVKMCGLPQ